MARHALPRLLPKIDFSNRPLWGEGPDRLNQSARQKHQGVRIAETFVTGKGLPNDKIIPAGRRDGQPGRLCSPLGAVAPLRENQCQFVAKKT